MSYLAWLRERVGTDPVLLVYATAIVRDDRGRVLFQHRADFSEWWGLPGGLLEPGETILETLRREVLEETGFVVEPARFVGLYTSPDYTIRYRNGDVVQQVTACFDCRIAGGADRPDGSESLAQEFRPAEAAPPLFPWYERMLLDARDGAPTRFDAGSALGENPRPEGLVRWLRGRVGREPILMPCACAVVRDAEGRILLQRRADSRLWGLPAGGMELGERIDRTIVREVEEETGLLVRPVRLTGFYAGHEQWCVYPNGDAAWLAVAGFLCEIEGGGLRADGVESLEVAFFDTDALPLDHLPWGPLNRRRIEDALRADPDAAAD